MSNESWWGKVAQRVIQRPAHTLVTGLVVFGALAFGALVLLAGRIRRGHRRPERERRRRRQRRLGEVLPPVELEPDQPHLELAAPGVEGPRGGRDRPSTSSRRPACSAPCPGPLDPRARRSRPRPTSACTPRSAIRSCSRPCRIAGSPGAKVPLALYDFYRATARFVSPDGHTIQFEAGLTAGDASSTPALERRPRHPGGPDERCSTTSAPPRAESPARRRRSTT